MKRLFSAAMWLTVALPAHASYYADEKYWNAIIAKAASLPIRKCEINDGTKQWKFVDGFVVGDLPVYRCTAEGKSATATFTQSPTAQNQESSSNYALFQARQRSRSARSFRLIGPPVAQWISGSMG